MVLVMEIIRRLQRCRGSRGRSIVDDWRRWRRWRRRHRVCRERSNHRLVRDLQYKSARGIADSDLLSAVGGMIPKTQTDIQNLVQCSFQHDVLVLQVLNLFVRGHLQLFQFFPQFGCDQQEVVECVVDVVLAISRVHSRPIDSHFFWA